jgi:hypothetical protein
MWLKQVYSPETLLLKNPTQGEIDVNLLSDLLASRHVVLGIVRVGFHARLRGHEAEKLYFSRIDNMVLCQDINHLPVPRASIGGHD